MEQADIGNAQSQVPLMGYQRRSTSGDFDEKNAYGTLPIYTSTQPPQSTHNTSTGCSSLLSSRTVKFFLSIALLLWITRFIYLILSPRTTIPSCPGYGPLQPDNGSPLIPFPICENTTHTSNFTYSFSDFQDFKILETVDSRVLGSDVVGKVHIQTGAPWQQEKIKVIVEINSTAHGRLEAVAFESGSQKGVRIDNLPDHDPIYEVSDSEKEGCTAVNVKILVQPTFLMFGLFDVAVAHLDVELAKGLIFEMYLASISTAIGDIASSELRPQFLTYHDLILSTAAGRIFGNWTLGASWNTTTGAGDIDVNLIPKRWSSGPTTKADIFARSSAGNIKVKMPFNEHALSLRDTKVDVQTARGNIDVDLVTGATTLIRSAVGSIRARLLPYYFTYDWQPRLQGNLTTETVTGMSEVEVLSPVWDDYYRQNPLNFTKSRHTTISGGLSIKYPDEWAGKLEGWSIIGSIELEGDELGDVKWGLAGRHVEATTKEDGDSKLDFHTITGNINVEVGE